MQNPIMKLRQQFGLSRHELATLLDRSTAWIGNLERGQNSLSEEMLKCLESTLGVDTNQIVEHMYKWNEERKDALMFKLRQENIGGLS